MTKARTNAVVSRIQTLPYLASKTFKLVAPRDSAGKLPTAPYVVVQPSSGTDTQERFTGAKATGHPRYVIHFVGSSYDNAQGVFDDVKALFIDPVSGFPYPINVTDEMAYAITWEAAQPVQVDNDLTPPLIYATAELSWSAEPI